MKNPRADFDNAITHHQEFFQRYHTPTVFFKSDPRGEKKSIVDTQDTNSPRLKASMPSQVGPEWEHFGGADGLVSET